MAHNRTLVSRPSAPRTVLCCLVLLFLARPAPGAEGSSIAQQVVGTWDVQSVTITSADGSVVDPFGSKPSGIIMLDTNGRYANVFGRADRPKIDAANRLAITPGQLGAAAKEFTANFGTWSVAATEMTITLRFVGSLDPNNEGTQATYALALSGNGMTFSITLPGQRLEVAKYRRAN